MVVVISIYIIKYNPEDLLMLCMLLDYAQNHTDSTYFVLNISIKHIVLSHDAIWTNKTYGKNKPSLIVILSKINTSLINCLT